MVGTTPYGMGGVRSVSGNNVLQSTQTSQSGELLLSNAANTVGVDTGSLTINGVEYFTAAANTAYLKVGAGTLVVGGAAANDTINADALYVQAGTLQLNKTGGVAALPTGVTTTIGNAAYGRGLATVQMGPSATANQIAITDSVVVEPSANSTWRPTMSTSSFGTLQIGRSVTSSGDVEIGNATLTIPATRRIRQRRHHPTSPAS